MHLNSALKPTELAGQYNREKRISISNILAADSATNLLNNINAFKAWNLHLNQGEKHFDLFPNQRNALTPEKSEALWSAATIGAQSGFQCYYENYPIYDAYRAGSCLELWMNSLYEFLNSRKFIDLMKKVTGHNDIRYADCQLTRFTSGDFLTTHKDDVDGKNRRAAFVLNMTPNWRPDYGGLLQFFNSDGNVEAGFTPSYNTLNIFSIPKPHAVSQVATFAPLARHSITGWLRTK